MSKKRGFGKFNFIIIALFIASVVALKIWQTGVPDAVLTYDNKEVRVMVAKDPATMYRGLGKRDSLEEFDGMLFVYNTFDRHGIVMREMRFPIDIVWLDRGEVTDMEKNVPLETGKKNYELNVYYPTRDVNMVLELRAGWLDEHGVEIGDRFEYNGE